MGVYKGHNISTVAYFSTLPKHSNKETFHLLLFWAELNYNVGLPTITGHSSSVTA